MRVGLIRWKSTPHNIASSVGTGWRGTTPPSAFGKGEN